MAVSPQLCYKENRNKIELFLFGYIYDRLKKMAQSIVFAGEIFSAQKENFGNLQVT